MVIDFRKLNEATRKDHYPLPFIDQMLERLFKHTHFRFLDGSSGFSQIPVSKEDQEKTSFTCPFSTFAYRRMPYSLTFVKILLRFSWMISPCMELLLMKATLIESCRDVNKLILS